MWADVDTKLDFLNYSEVAELVTDVVRDPAMRPVTVGVFGTWGTGKSTLLNLIEGKLNSAATESDFVVVRFDAWLYQGFDDSRAALMEVIATTLIEKAEDNPGLLAQARKLLGRVNGMRALGLLVEGGALAMGVPTFGWAGKGINALGNLISGAGGEEDVDTLKETGEHVKKRSDGLLNPEKQRTPPKEIAAFRAEFEAVLEGLNKTLVVFVDNLDRCLPKQTIHTLEALRLFLFMGHTAFVVAADEEMVRHSVSEYFKDLDDRHVTDYLDKLIQVPVRVPRLGVQEVRAYLFLLFASRGGLVDATHVEALRIGLESNLRKAWKDEPISTEAALALLGSSPPADVALGFGIADRMAGLLANSTLVQGNPRIVKRMLNVVRMRTRVATLREMPIDEALIAKFALFERCTDTTSIAHFYTEINAAAGGKPEVLVKLEQLLDDPENFKLACPEQWAAKAEFLREWLTLDPPLTGLDLRPLVYLSRETTPLRVLKGGLSEPAAEALKVLLRTSNTSSPSGRSAVRSIPDGEHTQVMSGLIQTFRSHTNWSARPQGFDGALMLAEHSADSGSLLSSFIHTVMPVKLSPWLKVLVKDTAWFKAKEKR
ncbi:putative KAP-like P-loop ATPase [Collimonas sp. PA-H2]|uniref:KAP family P-loop NTPase fold protein n=1 Tax=Collimonas sp. PA-H2 TaxID=1881062 RepID=UPI000BF6189C|nr:P-loop NTPase fold protein [Collimonas sp. PA-H2]PFH09153.1 putative KAP-like P-loop ATPase [Collimonas sp. PA-H2]